MLFPCPRCGAKNEVSASRCYACAAALDANALNANAPDGTAQFAPADIPDTLLDNAARLLREEAPPPRDTTGRMAVAVAGTLGILAFGLIVLPILLLLFAGWIFIPFSKAPAFAFFCYIGALFLCVVALWMWALFGASENQ